MVKTDGTPTVAWSPAVAVATPTQADLTDHYPHQVGCGCACCFGGFCGGCGHAGCGGRKR